MIGVASLIHVRARTRLLPLFDLSAIYVMLDREGITKFYPEFQAWFFGKVVPGLEAGERQIIEARVNGVLAGVAICKRDDVERKLCTLWVSPTARGRGVAVLLACSAFEWLDTDRPLFTVPEEIISEFGGLLRAWQFPAPLIYPNSYRSERVEYVFNRSAAIVAH